MDEEGVSGNKKATIICLGDVVGRPGRNALKKTVPLLQEQYHPDLIIANGENAAGGVGITPEIVAEFRALGIGIVTTGDHIWRHKEIIATLQEENPICIRAANYPAGVPGAGYTIQRLPTGDLVGVANLLGRTFMGSAIDCRDHHLPRVGLRRRPFPSAQALSS